MARTKAQLKKLHRELWQWLADNPGKAKNEWPRWNRVKEATNDCFACEVAGNTNWTATCPRCPADWGYDNARARKTSSDGYWAVCEYDKSPYLKWRNTLNKKLRTKYALQVRDAWK
jgi:hypothetical protein